MIVQTPSGIKKVLGVNDGILGVWDGKKAKNLLPIRQAIKTYNIMRINKEEYEIYIQNRPEHYTVNFAILDTRTNTAEEYVYFKDLGKLVRWDDDSAIWSECSTPKCISDVIACLSL